MTIDEAVEILERHGVHPSPHMKGLYLRDRGGTPGELVGEIEDDHVWIVKYLPSAIGCAYADVDKSLVSCDAPRARTVLETLLQDLAASAQRYEEDQRHERTRDVRKYFLERNKKTEMPDADAQRITQILPTKRLPV